jgi:hypothetical protein
MMTVRVIEFIEQLPSGLETFADADVNVFVSSW